MNAAPGPTPENPNLGDSTPATFRRPHPVRFADVDAAGIVYYPRLLDYCHVTFEEFFEGAGDRSYSSWIREARIGFPTVHLEVDFHRMVEYGRPLWMTAAIARIGDRSVVFRFTGELEDGTVAFEAEITKVCAGMDTGRPEPIPAELRTLFGAYLIPASEGDDS